MTKKFWNDWQKRIGETKQIYDWITYQTHEGIEKKRIGGSIIGYTPFKILSAKFNKNTVDLTLEIKREVWTKKGIHIHVENKYVTLYRKDIATIEFFK